jgi:hypothetical protein
MPGPTDQLSVADLVGPWVEPDFQSSLIERCRNAWNKPLREFTNLELATFLGQRFAAEHLLPIAIHRVASGIDDGTEFYEGHLQAAIERASKYP